MSDAKFSVRFHLARLMREREEQEAEDSAIAAETDSPDDQFWQRSNFQRMMRL